MLTQFTLLFVPSQSDYASGAMETLFSIMPRICAGSIIAYAISNTLDTYSFEWIKNRQRKHLWLRNCLSTLTSQLLDSFIFVFIAFYGTMPTGVVVELALTTYAVKAIVAVCDTPFVYVARRMDERKTLWQKWEDHKYK